MAIVLRAVGRDREVQLTCFFCEEDLEELTPDEMPVERIAYDPGLGRLWHVCPECQRWNPVPLDERWEMLEACERWASDAGEVLLKTEHLTLLSVGDGQLVRVGDAIRPEFADWRYSHRLQRFAIREPGFLVRALLRLPARQAGDHDIRTGEAAAMPAGPWVGTPFYEHGSILTTIFSQVPLAEACSSCGNPLIIRPAAFGDVEVLRDGSHLVAAAQCELCRERSIVDLKSARPALRLALAIVNLKHRSPKKIAGAAAPIEQSGSALKFVESLAVNGATIGWLSPKLRLALWMALDEWAEADALEAEWRIAEEVTAISDEELTEVPGFEEFRARVHADQRGRAD